MKTFSNENAKNSLSPRALRRLGRERDLYAVGKVLYMMLAHQSEVLQFPDINMSIIQKDITKMRLNAFLMQYACAVKRKRRFSSISNFKQAFNDCFKDYKFVEKEEPDEEDTGFELEPDSDTDMDPFAESPTEVLGESVSESSQGAAALPVSQPTGEGVPKNNDVQGQTPADAPVAVPANDAVPAEKGVGARWRMRPIWIINLLVGLLVLLLAIQVVYEWWKNRAIREYHNSPVQEFKVRE